MEIGRGLFEIFGKLEDGVSKFSNIPIFGRNQMNEPLVAKLMAQINVRVLTRIRDNHEEKYTAVPLRVFVLICDASVLCNLS